jgi:hypothetical protein
MLIDGVDYRWLEERLEICWEGVWMTPYKATRVSGSENLPSSVWRRFRAAIEGSPVYASWDVRDLVMARADGAKTLTPISRCPKALALFILWLYVAEHDNQPLPAEMWLMLIVDWASCGKAHFAQGLCRHCYQYYDRQIRPKSTEQGLANIRARNTSSDRKRDKALHARRKRLIDDLLQGKRKNPLSLDGVALVVAERFDDLTDEEFEKFVTLTHARYEAEWLAAGGGF